jgi:hypothetical protein
LIFILARITADMVFLWLKPERDAPEVFSFCQTNATMPVGRQYAPFPRFTAELLSHGRLP